MESAFEQFLFTHEMKHSSVFKVSNISKVKVNNINKVRGQKGIAQPATFLRGYSPLFFKLLLLLRIYSCFDLRR